MQLLIGLLLLAFFIFFFIWSLTKNIEGRTSKKITKLPSETKPNIQVSPEKFHIQGENYPKIGDEFSTTREEREAKLKMRKQLLLQMARKNFLEKEKNTNEDISNEKESILEKKND